MPSLAETYVRLVLAVGQHDPDCVDAYYGPAHWRPDEGNRRPLLELRAECEMLRQRLAGAELHDEPQAARRRYLDLQVIALETRIRMLLGDRFAFDEESRLLYDAVAPVHDEAYFAGALDELDARLPGPGAVAGRLEAFRAAFAIPTDRLDPVFLAAIEAGRARTQEHIPLPPGERFTVEYVTNKPWSGYNWYKGAATSVIQVNTDLPIFIDRAIDLACHEGYPGHHVYNVLLEQQLVGVRGWLEFSVYALFSPQSLVAEGTANYGIDLALPRAERAAFEAERLFPLAGLPPARAAEYYEVVALTERLAYAGNEAARGYLDGRLTRAEAVDWLEHYGVQSRARAEQRLRFIERYRSYVINYNLGKDLVRADVERNPPATRWSRFRELLSSPVVPSSLATQG